MGAWGTGSFENDDAHDWLNDFFDAPSLAAVEEPLKIAAEFDAREYLEMPECGAAVAAAEIVAGLVGTPNPDMPDDLKQWVQGQQEQNLASGLRFVNLAQRAVARVRFDSEMKDSWIDEDLRQKWYAEMTNLETRLSRVAF